MWEDVYEVLEKKQLYFKNLLKSEAERKFKTKVKYGKASFLRKIKLIFFAIKPRRGISNGIYYRWRWKWLKRRYRKTNSITYKGKKKGEF